jgi:hypothetical protein
MIQIKHIAAQLTERVWAVQVPEWANAFKVNCIPEADFYELDCYELGEYNEPVKEDSISLFPGSATSAPVKVLRKKLPKL